jgi:hypothetical protein
MSRNIVKATGYTDMASIDLIPSDMLEGVRPLIANDYVASRWSRVPIIHDVTPPVKERLKSVQPLFWLRDFVFSNPVTDDGSVPSVLTNKTTVLKACTWHAKSFVEPTRFSVWCSDDNVTYTCYDQCWLAEVVNAERVAAEAIKLANARGVVRVDYRKALEYGDEFMKVTETINKLENTIGELRNGTTIDIRPYVEAIAYKNATLESKQKDYEEFVARNCAHSQYLTYIGKVRTSGKKALAYDDWVKDIASDLVFDVSTAKANLTTAINSKEAVERAIMRKREDLRNLVPSLESNTNWCKSIYKHNYYFIWGVADSVKTIIKRTAKTSLADIADYQSQLAILENYLSNIMEWFGDGETSENVIAEIRDQERRANAEIGYNRNGDLHIGSKIICNGKVIRVTQAYLDEQAKAAAPIRTKAPEPVTLVHEEDDDEGVWQTVSRSSPGRRRAGSPGRRSSVDLDSNMVAAANFHEGRDRGKAPRSSDGGGDSAPPGSAGHRRR